MSILNYFVYVSFVISHLFLLGSGSITPTLPSCDDDIAPDEMSKWNIHVIILIGKG